MKRLLLFMVSLALLVVPYPYLYGQEEQVPITFSVSSTEGGGITALNLSASHSEVQSGDKVKVGDKIMLTTSINPGWYIKGWMINGENRDSQEKDITYTVLSTGNDIVVRLEAHPTEGYPVTYQAGENGRFVEVVWLKNMWSPQENLIDSGDKVPAESIVKFDVKPNEGYVVDTWKANGEILPDQHMNILWRPVTSPLNVEVSFKKLAHYTLTLKAKGAGKIRATNNEGTELADGSQVLEGTYVTFTAEPDEGFVLSHFDVNGEERKDSWNPNKINLQVDKNLTVEAVFKAQPKMYTITPIEKPYGRIVTTYIDDEGYSVTSDIPKPILEGTEVTMVASPETDYVTKAWYYNGLQVAASAENPNEYKFVVSEDAEIYAMFGTKAPAPDMVPLSFTSPVGGVISARYLQGTTEIFPESGDNVPSGIEVIFSVQLQEGYQVSKWVINHQEQPSMAGMSEITYTVEQATTVAVVLEQAQVSKKRYKITPYQKPNGQIVTTYIDEEGYSVTSDIPKQILEGTEVTMVASPSIDYVTEAWYYNGRKIEPSAETPNEYKFVVSEDADIYAVFTEGESGFVVNFEAGEHGQFTGAEALTPSGILRLNSGDKVPVGSRITLTAAPDDGYEVDQWYVNEQLQASFGGKAGYVGEVKMDTSIRVTFKRSASAPESYELHFSSSDEQLGIVRAVNADTEAVIEDGAKVSNGTKVRFEAISKKPDTYLVDKWIVNGNTMADSKDLLNYTVTIDAPISVRVVFRDATSVELIEMGDIQTYIVGDQLFVRGAMSPVEVALYTAEGYLIFVRDVVEMTDVSTLPQGVYFVSIAGKSYRVLK